MATKKDIERIFNMLKTIKEELEDLADAVDEMQEAQEVSKGQIEDLQHVIGDTSKKFDAALNTITVAKTTKRTPRKKPAPKKKKKPVEEVKEDT